MPIPVESRPQLAFPSLGSSEQELGQAKVAFGLVEKVFGYDTGGMTAIEVQNTWPSPLFLVCWNSFLKNHTIELDQQHSHPNRLVVRVSPSLSGGASIEIKRERGMLLPVADSLAAEKNLTVTLCRDRDGKKPLRVWDHAAAVSLADPAHIGELPHQAPIQLAVVFLGSVGNRLGRNEELVGIVAVA